MHSVRRVRLCQSSHTSEELHLPPSCPLTHNGNGLGFSRIARPLTINRCHLIPADPRRPPERSAELLLLRVPTRKVRLLPAHRSCLPAPSLPSPSFEYAGLSFRRRKLW